jgi:hypothetical protein
MTEAILRNYFLFTAACTILGSAITIFIFKYDSIKRFLNHKIIFLFKKKTNRDEIYDVLKELTPLHKRYVRRMVREYLYELQKPAAKAKARRNTKKKNV